MKVKISAASKTVDKALELQEKGDVSGAEKLFRKALAAAPTDWRALFSLGRILSAAGKLDESLKLLNRLVLVNPQYAPCLDLQGVVLEKMGRHDEAIAAIVKSLSVSPNSEDTLVRYGALLCKLNRDDQAIVWFERALAVNPNHQMALANLGKALHALKRYDHSSAACQTLLSINPHYRFARGLLAYNRLHEVHWIGLEATISQITLEIQSGLPSCMPLAYMAMSDSVKDNLHCARMFANHFHPRSAVSFWNGEKYRHEKIRIAYISSDFRAHPVGQLMVGVIEQHDHSRFETIGVFLGMDDQSELNARFRTSFDRFIDARLMGSLELCHLVRDLEIDVAIDLCGFTGDARTDLFASRVAPIQVNFLGYPGTMGTSYMDFIVADKCVITEAESAFYDERIAWMPDTYLPTDSRLGVSTSTPTRAQAGLPPTGFVFCSFNNIYKINPRVFGAWMQILGATDGSVLWLSKPDTGAIANLRLEAQRRGIDPDRLVFADRVPLVEDHLARYRLADLFLDTTPYNAHTTAADALFVGLPVVTCLGSTFSGKVAGSLLQAIGMPELITESIEQYVQLALDLSRDPVRLAGVKQKLMNNKTTHPLFQTRQYCRHLEAAFSTMHSQHQAGLGLSNFSVERQTQQ